MIGRSRTCSRCRTTSPQAIASGVRIKLEPASPGASLIAPVEPGRLRCPSPWSPLQRRDFGETMKEGASRISSNHRASIPAMQRPTPAWPRATRISLFLWPRTEMPPEAKAGGPARRSSSTPDLRMRTRRLARACSSCDWDWAGAKEHFRRARRASIRRRRRPGVRGEGAVTVGRFDDAIVSESWGRTRSTAPGNAGTRSGGPGRRASTIRPSSSTDAPIEIDPQFFPLYFLGIIYVQKGVPLRRKWSSR